jgi:hypothetical protein
MHSQNTAMAHLEQRRRCSRCQAKKPLSDFCRNPASICKRCHNAATGHNSEVRRRATGRLIDAHRDEFRRLVADERTRETTSKQVEGGGSDAA